MFANLKKKLEEGGAVSPVGAERKAGNSSIPASNSSRTQNQLCQPGVAGGGRHLTVWSEVS